MVKLSVESAAAKEEVHKTSVTFPKALFGQLKLAAFEEGRDQQDLIVDAVRMYLASQKKARK